jgi:uncharacterized membrane protein YfcA
MTTLLIFALACIIGLYIGARLAQARARRKQGKRGPDA